MKEINDKQINQNEIIIDENFYNGFSQVGLFDETLNDISILHCGDSG